MDISMEMKVRSRKERRVDSWHVTVDRRTGQRRKLDAVQKVRY